MSDCCRIIGTLTPTGQISGTLAGVGTLSGAIAGVGLLSCTLAEAGQLSGTLESEAGTLTGALTVAAGPDVPIYTGDYTVTPQAYTEQVLPTAYKLMRDNVTVREVPYYETSNDYGETVYIASEV